MLPRETVGQSENEHLTGGGADTKPAGANEERLVEMLIRSTKLPS